jgi:hypothetical protein
MKFWKVKEFTLNTSWRVLSCGIHLCVIHQEYKLMSQRNMSPTSTGYQAEPTTDLLNKNSIELLILSFGVWDKQKHSLHVGTLKTEFRSYGPHEILHCLWSQPDSTAYCILSVVFFINSWSKIGWFNMYSTKHTSISFKQKFMFMHYGRGGRSVGIVRCGLRPLSFV